MIVARVFQRKLSLLAIHFTSMWSSGTLKVEQNTESTIDEAHSHQYFFQKLESVRVQKPFHKHSSANSLGVFSHYLPVPSAAVKNRKQLQSIVNICTKITETPVHSL